MDLSLFECTLCFDYFRDPRVIGCGHTFCFGCLKNLNPSRLQCPLCRYDFDNPSSLPSNFVVLKWMDEMTAQNANFKNKVLQCENCKEDLALMWCEQCGTHYCKECDSATHTDIATRSHVRLPLAGKSKKPSFTQCHHHHKDNKFFCLDCHSSVCSVCKEDGHPVPQHRTMSLSKYGEIVRKELKEAVGEFGEIVGYFREKREEIRGEMQEVQKERDELMRRWKEMDERLKGMVKEEEGFGEKMRKVETSQVVLIKSIEEVGIIQLSDSQFVGLMRNRIKNINDDWYPIQLKIEKERLEKERLEKERLEIVWDKNYSAPNSTIYGPSISCTHGGALLKKCINSNEKTTWEIAIDQKKSDNYFSIGVAQRGTNINSWQSYGFDDKGWGWGSGLECFSHNYSSPGSTREILENIIQVTLEKNRLYFSANGVQFGQHPSIINGDVYPAVISYRHQKTFTIISFSSKATKL